MSCVGQETSGICQHADEVGKQSQVRQTGQLVDHTLPVVIEPPGTALLDLANAAAVLEAADDGSDGCVVSRI